MTCSVDSALPEVVTWLYGTLYIFTFMFFCIIAIARMRRDRDNQKSINIISSGSNTVNTTDEKNLANTLNFDNDNSLHAQSLAIDVIPNSTRYLCVEQVGDAILLLRTHINTISIVLILCLPVRIPTRLTAKMRRIPQPRQPQLNH